MSSDTGDKKQGRMREQMPVVTALIDDLRKAFGTEYINKIIAGGMRGEPVFSASENGHTMGTPVERGVSAVKEADGTRWVVQADGSRTKYVSDGERRAAKKGDIEWK